MENREFQKIAIKVSIVSLAVNVLLSIFKLIAGFLATSGAMISDAIHSVSDVFSTIIVMIGIKFSSEEEDNDHPYGHERMECVSALVLAFILGLIGLMIGIKGVENILAKNALKIPGMLALIASIVSIVSKEAMYQYTKYHALRINSTALMADGWHHRSDALSSVGALIGVFFARRGIVIADAIASVVIAMFIIKAAYDIFKDAIDKMVDHSASKDEEEAMLNVALKVEGVKRIDLIKTRMFGSKIYVDIEIACDGNKTLFEVHEIAEKVHNIIENQFKDVKHIMVHVNPYQDNE